MRRKGEPNVIKIYRPKGGRNQRRTLKRILDVKEQNGATSGTTLRQLDDDDDDDITYSECVIVALGIQHAERMRHIILSSVACPSLTYFSTLSYKRYNFRGRGKLLNVKCVHKVHTPTNALFIKLDKSF